jgi:hypothetical protein
VKDTIDLLEAIGRDASLRYASADDLVAMLKGAQASAALTDAVASGDSSRLSMEFGPKPMSVPHTNQAPGREDDEPEEEGLEEPSSVAAFDRAPSSSLT